jgi:hypothetical protein
VREKETNEAAGPAPAVRRRFADFADPFMNGIAARYPPDELVRYTFEALEAWGADNGLPRKPEQTAHEFAQQLGEAAAGIARNARLLADLYSRAAYAPGSLSDASLRRLEELWRDLRGEAVMAAPTSTGESQGGVGHPGST